MNGGASRIPLVLAVLAVLVLVGVVAVASTGSTAAGTDETRAPADILLDTFFSLALLALIPAAALFVYGLAQRKEIAREVASGRYRRTGIASFLVFMLLFSAVVYFRLRNWNPVFGGEEPGGVVGPEGTARPPERGPGTGTEYEPRFAWIPVLVVVMLAATGIAAYVIAARRRGRAIDPADEDVAEQVAEDIDETLDDLRAEPDPRRAVIAAYARLERALGASGVPRRPAETAEEYVARVLDRLDVDGVPVRVLTDLFAWAKFSQHDVDEAMKLRAIASLEQIRNELRDAAQRREEERDLARAAEPEQVASA
jgi:hypothetical protein